MDYQCLSRGRGLVLTLPAVSWYTNSPVAGPSRRLQVHRLGGGGLKVRTGALHWYHYVYRIHPWILESSDVIVAMYSSIEEKWHKKGKVIRMIQVDSGIYIENDNTRFKDQAYIQPTHISELKQ